MESGSNTALLIAILIIIAILVASFFIRLRQLEVKQSLEDGEGELKVLAEDSRPASTSSSLRSPAEILNASVITITRERASIRRESPRPQLAPDQLQADIISFASAQATHGLYRPTDISIRSERDDRSSQLYGSNQSASLIHHPSPSSPKYPNSLCTVTSLPSYPETTHSLSPPPYSDLSRTHTRTTSSEYSPRMTYREDASESMPELGRLRREHDDGGVTHVGRFGYF